MDLKINISILILIVFSSSPVFSQGNPANHKININIPEVALLSLVSDNSTNISFQSVSPGGAGNSVSFSGAIESADIWINYSSVIRNNNHLRKIEAMISGDVPEGIRLMVEASEASGTGKGKLGLSGGLISLSNQPAKIITNIGTCYTGKGAHNGHFLIWKLEFDGSAANYAQLTQSEISFNVVYTLTDDN